MSPLLYILKRSFINNVKLIKRKPSKLIPILFYLILLIYCAVVPYITKGSHGRSIAPSYFIGASTLATTLLLLSTIYLGVNKRSSSFLMSDVNFAFTSPIKPQNILMYGFIKEIQTSMVASLFLLFQIPNLINSFNLVPSGVFVLLVAYLLFVITMSFTSVLAYSICSKSPITKYVLRTVIIFLGAYVILSAIYCGYSNRSTYLFSITSMFNNKFINYIPVIGWIKAIITQCFTGFNISLLIYISLLAVFLSIIMIFLYNLDLDFYEDVLDKSELNETMKNIRTKQLKSKNLIIEGKKGRTRKVTYKYEATLGQAIFRKHLLEYRKTGFGLLNMYTGILLLGAIVYGLFFPIKEITIFLYFSIYLGCISNFASKFNYEIVKPYIFLIPDNDDKKIFWATLSSIIKYVSDSFIVFLVLGIIIKATPLDVLLCIVVYISFGFVFTYGSVLNLRLFGGINSDALKGLLMFFSVVLYVLPGIIGAAIIASELSFLGEYAMYFSFVIWNAFASVVILQLSKGILKHIELD